MKFYTLTTVLLGETMTSVHGSFADVVKTVNTVLEESDSEFSEILKEYCERVFGKKISGASIGEFLEILSEIGTPSETGFLFSDYLVKGGSELSGYVMVNCTVHEVELSDVGSLHFTNPVI